MVSISAQALVVREAGSQPALEDIELVEPEGDEVLVSIRATGICHTDLSAADGTLPVPFPTVLGHEAAGVVEQVGPLVTRAQPGDRVVIAVTHHCGRCRMCARGFPPLCEERFTMRPRLRTAAGPLQQGFGTATFATATVVRERSIVRVPDTVPLEVAAVSGCAVATGCGAVLNDAQVRPGSTVLVLGCGGVGLSAIMAARLAGAGLVVAADPVAERRAGARSAGADLALAPDEETLRATRPGGFDYCFESAGRLEAMELGLALAGPAATITLMGLTGPQTRLSVPVLSYCGNNLTLIGCNMGRLRPDLDFPTYFEQYAAGRLPLDLLVGTRLPLAEFAAAFDLARTGGSLRVLMTP